MSIITAESWARKSLREAIALVMDYLGYGPGPYIGTRFRERFGLPPRSESWLRAEARRQADACRAGEAMAAPAAIRPRRVTVRAARAEVSPELFCPDCQFVREECICQSEQAASVAELAA